MTISLLIIEEGMGFDMVKFKCPYIISSRNNGFMYKRAKMCLGLIKRNENNSKSK